AGHRGGSPEVCWLVASVSRKHATIDMRVPSCANGCGLAVVVSVISCRSHRRIQVQSPQDRSAAAFPATRFQVWHPSCTVLDPQFFGVNLEVSARLKLRPRRRCVPRSLQSQHTGDATMEPFYSDVGPGYGSVMYRDVVGSIGVFEDPEGAIAIGTARCIGSDAAGSAVWRLILEDEEFEGAWVIVDREFM